VLAHKSFLGLVWSPTIAESRTRARRNVVKRINLSMRVINRCTNFASAIFKDQYVVNVCTRTQFGCSLRPQIDHASHSCYTEARK
jgi:hypothetical protein